MCGIAGIFNLDGKPLDKETVIRFTDTLEHRGPDGSGYYVDANASLGLGHRRLSILDLSEMGKQPMSFLDERYWITFNGEVFNFFEIRTELERFGFKFKSESDTEVILAAYIHWGKDCVNKFNGMWAFAIWDSQNESLFLSRDHFGIKPLYYLYIPGKIFAFSSETISFKSLDGFQRSWNKKALSATLKNQFLLEGKGYTTFDNIFQVLPGHSILINKDKKIVQERWWSTLNHKTNVSENYSTQVEEFRSLLTDSCLLRLRSDVPIASALSGGLDSSALYCMLNEIFNNPNMLKIRTPSSYRKAFVATFPNTNLDEKSFAEEVIKFTNGDASYLIPDYKNLVSDIESSTLLFDSIYFTPISIVSNIYKQMYGSGFKISMDGHGVDEMLLGYPHFSRSAYESALSDGNDALANEYWETYISMHEERLHSALNGQRNDGSINNVVRENIKKAFRRFAPDVLKNKISKVRSGDSSNWYNDIGVFNLKEFEGALEKVKFSNSTDEMLYENFHVSILPTILRNFDRASMQNSIEIRMPFMDHRLVSYVFSLPLSSKLGGGYTKKILRDAMMGHMPESIRLRKLKIGLNAPMTYWFGNEMSEYILDEVHSTAFLKNELWNGKAIQEFAINKVKNKSWEWDESGKFWTILNCHILMNKS